MTCFFDGQRIGLTEPCQGCRIDLRPLATIAFASQDNNLRAIGGIVVDRQTSGSLPRASRLEGDADRAGSLRGEAHAAGIGLTKSPLTGIPVILTAAPPRLTIFKDLARLVVPSR